MKFTSVLYECDSFWALSSSLSFSSYFDFHSVICLSICFCFFSKPAAWLRSCMSCSKVWINTRTVVDGSCEVFHSNFSYVESHKKSVEAVWKSFSHFLKVKVQILQFSCNSLFSFIKSRVLALSSCEGLFSLFQFGLKLASRKVIRIHKECSGTFMHAFIHTYTAQSLIVMWPSSTQMLFQWLIKSLLTSLLPAPRS